MSYLLCVFGGAVLGFFAAVLCVAGRDPEIELSVYKNVKDEDEE